MREAGLPSQIHSNHLTVTPGQPEIWCCLADG
jgi:hypothetical protein